MDAGAAAAVLARGVNSMFNMFGVAGGSVTRTCQKKPNIAACTASETINARASACALVVFVVGPIRKCCAFMRETRRRGCPCLRGQHSTGNNARK